MLVIYYTLAVMQLVTAIEQCEKYQFQSPFFPGVSCEDIYAKNPESRDISGYYYITDGPNRVYCGMTYVGSSCEDIYNNNPETGDKSGYYRIGTQWTYCDMLAVTTCFAGDASVRGGWRRVAFVDTSMGGDCPRGWRRQTHSGISFCRVVSDGSHAYSSAFFSTNGNSKSYQKVCGMARGYQKGRSLAFSAHYHFHYNLSYSLAGYADGLLITYGSPRNHIWSYVNGRWDNRQSAFNCPCAGGYSSPLFIGRVTR